MGKSAYLFTPAKHRSVHAQLRKLRDDLGQGLRLEGPFSDNDGAVADIATHVRAVSLFSRISPIDATALTLRPQNRLPEGLRPSLLKMPFILEPGQEGGWRNYPESAGGVASRSGVEYNGGWARPAGASELNILAVAVLRALDVECHLSRAVCHVPEIDERITRAGGISAGVLVPAITCISGSESRMLSIVPEHMAYLGNSSLTSFEVLDSDAVLSVIKLRNTLRHAKALMLDVARHEERFDGERSLRFIRMGHMLHEGMTLWTMRDAKADLASARGIFGPGKLEGVMSFREMIGRDVVRTLTNPVAHARSAASLMLPKELLRRLGDYAQNGSRILTVSEFLDMISKEPAMAMFGEYVLSTPIINEHMHAASTCVAG